MTPLLELRDFCVSFATPSGPVQAVRNIDLTVHNGEVMGIVGESGAGKSTLINAIMTLLAPQAQVSGTMTFDGHDLYGLSPKQRRALRGNGIATIFQDPFTTFNPVTPIGRQLVEFQHWRQDLTEADRRQRAQDMLARVGLTDPALRMRQYPRQLSGGARQRVGIAAALLSNPRLLIADEATTALDATTEAQIIDLLREVRSLVEGAIIFVTHDLGLVSTFCDRVAVMYAGELLEVAPVDRDFSALRHPYSRALLACDPIHLPAGNRNFPSIAGHVPDLRAPRSGCVFAPRCVLSDHDCTREAPRWLRSSATGFTRCHRIAP